MVENLFEVFTSSSYKDIAWFFIFLVVFYVPYLYIKIKKKNNKANTYIQQHPDAVKVYMERTKLNDLLTIWNVNGNKPVMFSKNIKSGFYLLPGENIIDVKYQWTTVSINSISGYETHTAKDMELKLIVEINKEYLLSYGHDLEEYAFVEK